MNTLLSRFATAKTAMHEIFAPQKIRLYGTFPCREVNFIASLGDRGPLKEVSLYTLAPIHPYTLAKCILVVVSEFDASHKSRYSVS